MSMRINFPGLALLLPLLIFTSINVQAQSEAQSQVLDVFMQETKVKKQAETMLAGIIRGQMRNKPNAPESVYQEIQQAIDYDGYLQRVKAAYAEAYTKAEIEEMTWIYQAKEMDLFKEKGQRVAKTLYAIGKEFGKESMEVIKEKLRPYS